MRIARTLAVVFMVGVACLGLVHAVEFRASAQGSSISHPIWGVTLEVPGFSWMEHSLEDRPNFVLAASSEQDSCTLLLSMFAIQVTTGTTADECRKSYPGNPDALRADPTVTIHLVEASPIVFTLYDHSASPGGPLQNQLYGYWSYSETCFELHVSSLMCPSFAELALPILRSVEILDQPDVTLETVAVSQAIDEDPRHWNVHLQVAGAYLHRVDPPETARARRFYASALRLGGDAIPVKEQWLIEEGIGLSWLIENEGPRAIPHLEKSVELGRQNPTLIDEGGESLYNLACAQSLAGNQEEACESLQDLMQRQNPKERKQTLADIRQDSQLKRVRKSSCYDGVVARVKGK